MKTELCEAKGYRLIHIWQDDWQNNKEEINQKLIEIFENTEIIQFNTWLDRSWYSILNYNNIQLKQPQLKYKNYK